MQEMGSVLGRWQCPGGGQLQDQPPLAILLLSKWASNTLPTSSCEKKIKMFFLFFPLPVKTPAAELQEWPAATSSGRTQGLCRALGEPWPLWLEQDPRVWWQRCTSFRAWCRGWVLLLNAALSSINTPSIAKSTRTTQVHQRFASS